MSIITEFTTSTDAFALRSALRAVPEMHVEGELMVTHSDEWVMPFLWASGGDFEAFEAELREDPTVEQVTTVQSFDGARLYGFEWCEDVREILNAILDRHGMLLEATARDTRWKLKIRFANRDQLDSLQTYFESHGSGFTMRRLYEPNNPEQGSYNLTDKQWEALVLALNAGYYDVPRETSARELAERLGISRTAVSERLRRATAALVSSALTFDERPTRQSGSRYPEE